MSDKSLVERLREEAGYWSNPSKALLNEAADSHERLEKEVDRLNARCTELANANLDDFEKNDEALAEVIGRNANLEAELALLRETVGSICKAYCVGREAYSGKNRHEPNCAAYELDIALDDFRRKVGG